MKRDGLDRFLLAQERNHADAEREIAQGRKSSHWMWYVFPQLRGLGRSNFAQLYGIADLDEAAAYIAHPVLGPRLIRMMGLMLRHEGCAPEDILGGIDAMKLRSSATLFAELPEADPVFGRVLDAFYDGRRCEKTLELLGR